MHQTPALQSLGARHETRRSRRPDSVRRNPDRHASPSRFHVRDERRPAIRSQSLAYLLRGGNYSSWLEIRPLALCRLK